MNKTVQCIINKINYKDFSNISNSICFLLIVLRVYIKMKWLKKVYIISMINIYISAGSWGDTPFMP